ncbi:MAG: hypothetical protein DME74_12135 [Verrucomicrobia bacterium]|nr:MAG: hypothetical protein DME74_12135 [Verrucomicrobiota bacterium]
MFIWIVEHTRLATNSRQNEQNFQNPEFCLILSILSKKTFAGPLFQIAAALFDDSSGFGSSRRRDTFANTRDGRAPQKPARSPEFLSSASTAALSGLSKALTLSVDLVFDTRS